jgi:hypothetical protein
VSTANRLVDAPDRATVRGVKFLRSVALCGWALVGWAGCYREVSDATGRPVAAGENGAMTWTIDGVRPGQDFAEVTRRWGEPQEIRGGTGARTARWERRETVVTFGPDGRVTEVMGSTVQAGGRVLVSGGATEAEVTAVLGRGTVQKSHRPGSGVIGVGREHSGTALIYDAGGVRFELPVFGEATGKFLARRMPPR